MIVKDKYGKDRNTDKNWCVQFAFGDGEKLQWHTLKAYKTIDDAYNAWRDLLNNRLRWGEPYNKNNPPDYIKWMHVYYRISPAKYLFN